MLVVDSLVVMRDNTALQYHFTLAAGKVLAIQGRSGVGKSTLLAAIAGFVMPDSGHIRWQHQSLDELPALERPVSMLFQDHNLFEHLSVRDNLMLGFGSHAIPIEALQKGAEQLSIATYFDKKPSALSGGQRQRVAILRTLLRPEPLVLLDEPFAELDDATRQVAIQWVKQTAQEAGKTLLLVTHQQEDVEQLADEVLDLTPSVIKS